MGSSSKHEIDMRKDTHRRLQRIESRAKVNTKKGPDRIIIWGREPNENDGSPEFSGEPLIIEVNRNGI